MSFHQQKLSLFKWRPHEISLHHRTLSFKWRQWANVWGSVITSITARFATRCSKHACTCSSTPSHTSISCRSGAAIAAQHSPTQKTWLSTKPSTGTEEGSTVASGVTGSSSTGLGSGSTCSLTMVAPTINATCAPRRFPCSTSCRSICAPTATSCLSFASSAIPGSCTRSHCAGTRGSTKASESISADTVPRLSSSAAISWSTKESTPGNGHLLVTSATRGLCSEDT